MRLRKLAVAGAAAAAVFLAWALTIEHPEQHLPLQPAYENEQFRIFSLR